MRLDNEVVSGRGHERWHSELYAIREAYSTRSFRVHRADFYPQGSARLPEGK